MKNTAPIPCFHAPIRSTRSGSTLVAAVLTVLVLSLIAANVLTSISSRYNSAYRSAGWNEALLAAESGVDITLSEVFRLVPNVSMSPTQGLGVGYSQPSLDLETNLIKGLQFSASGLVYDPKALALNFAAPTLPGTDQQANISLQVVPLNDLLSGGPTGLLNSVSSALNGNTINLLRIRSTGTVSLPGGTIAGPSRLDNELWRPSLVTDRNTKQAVVNGPSVSRQVEAILRPVYPFESAVVSNGNFSSTDPGAVFDSFNSTQDASSTNKQYDSKKCLTNGTIRSNAANMAIKGLVYGNIDTNGGNVPQNGQLTGTVNNAAYTPLPLVNAPTWNGVPVYTNIFGLAPVLVTSVTGSITLPAGVLAPLQYKFNGISGSLHITQGALSLTQGALNLGAVEIYINGDITGSIEIDPGITAKIYVSGSINTNASQLKNDSLQASNFQIYGVPNASSTSQSIKINMNSNLAAAIYAPAHDVTLNGISDYSGSLVCNAFQAANAVRVHYDEVLAASVGPLLRFEIASWKEITN